MPEGPSRREERTVRAGDGRALFVRDHGPAPGMPSGVPLLCLPGLARNSKDFADLAGRYAARGHRVVCPDYRGRGRSARDPDWRHYRPQRLLDDLRHVLCALQTGPVVAIGTSMGGLLAMAMGAAMPTLLRGVVLNDIGPDVADGGLGRIVEYLQRDPRHPDWDAAVADLQTMMPTTNPGPGPEATPADWRRLAEASYRPGEDGRLHPDWDPAIAEPLVRGEPVPDLWPYFRSLGRVPVLAIRGGRSDILSAETLARMAAHHPRLTALTLPAKGHAPTLDEPESLEAIDALLATVGG